MTINDSRVNATIYMKQTRYQEAESELSTALNLLLTHFTSGSGSGGVDDKSEDIKGVKKQLNQCRGYLLGI